MPAPDRTPNAHLLAIPALLALFAACGAEPGTSASPDPVAGLPGSAASRPGGASGPAAPDSAAPEPGSARDAAWRWDMTQPDFSESEAVNWPGGRVVFSPGTDRKGEIFREDAGKRLWSRNVPAGHNDATLYATDSALFAASWDAASAGASVARLDPATGADLWRADLAGLSAPGPTYTRAQVRFDRDRLVVHVEESSGRYTEVFDPAQGTRLFRRVETEETP